MPGLVRLPCGVRRIVAELVVLDQQPKHIDAEAIDATLQPEAQYIVHRTSDMRDFASSDLAVP